MSKFSDLISKAYITCLSLLNRLEYSQRGDRYRRKEYPGLPEDTFVGAGEGQAFEHVSKGIVMAVAFVVRY